VRYPGDEALGYEDLLPMVEGALPAEGRFVLVAESFSGPLALRIAARRPPGLAAIVLCASFITNPVWGLPSWMAPLARPWLFRLLPRFVQTWALLGNHPSPALRQLFWRAQARVRPEVLAARARAILAVDAAADLRACEVPIFYLRGTRDRVVSEASLRALVSARPEIRVRDIDAPHLVLQAAPEACLAAIREALAAVEAG
jgi:pimeloyl-ACP methyl ester carboxylesterase